MMDRPSQNMPETPSGTGIPLATRASRPPPGQCRTDRRVGQHIRPTTASAHPNTPALHHSSSSHRSNSPDWEARYQSGDMHWDKGAPSPGLVDFLAAHPELPRGVVCIPGCGTRHDVRAWAQAGFDAFGFDVAPSAIRMAAEKTKAAGLTAQYQLADFLRDEPPFQF